MSETPNFESWAIVEIMGHRKYAGKVTEQVIGGTSFVRIDVPAILDDNPDLARPEFCKFFGGNSIYCITPVAEDVARAMVMQLQERPIPLFEIRQLQNADTQKNLGFMDHDYDEFDDEMPEF